MEEEKSKNNKTLIIILSIVGAVVLIGIIASILFVKIIKTGKKEFEKQANNIIDKSSEIINDTKEKIEEQSSDDMHTYTKYYEDNNYLVEIANDFENQCQEHVYKVFDKNNNKYLEFTYEKNGYERNADITGFIKDNDTYYALYSFGTAYATTTIRNLTTNEDVRSITGAVECEETNICYFSSCPSTVIKINRSIWSPQLESIKEYHTQDEHHISMDKKYTYISNNDAVYVIDNNNNYNIISSHKFEKILDSDEEYYLVYENNNLNIYKYDGELIATVAENENTEAKDYIMYRIDSEIVINYSDSNVSTQITYNLDTKEIIHSSTKIN